MTGQSMTLHKAEGRIDFGITSCQSRSCPSLHQSGDGIKAESGQVSKTSYLGPGVESHPSTHALSTHTRRPTHARTHPRQEQRALLHRQDPGGALLSTLRVGRLFQEDFFFTLLPDGEARGRDPIARNPAPQPPRPPKRPHARAPSLGPAPARDADQAPAGTARKSGPRQCALTLHAHAMHTCMSQCGAPARLHGCTRASQLKGNYTRMRYHTSCQ